MAIITNSNMFHMIFCHDIYEPLSTSLLSGIAICVLIFNAVAMYHNIGKVKIYGDDIVKYRSSQRPNAYNPRHLQ